MPVRAVHDDEVHAGVLQGRRPGKSVFPYTDACADAKPAELVLAGVRVFFDLHDVLDCDEAFEPATIIHHEQLFDAALLEEFLGIFERNADRGGYQVLLRHELGDLHRLVRFEAKVPVGDDADELVPLYHGNAGNPVLGHQLENIADLLVGIDGYRIDDHAALGLFHLVYFMSLRVDAHVAVDDADSPFPGQANGCVRFGYAIHGGADQRNTHRNGAREHCRNIRFGRKNSRIVR